MKKIILFIFMLFCLGALQQVEAKGVIVYHSGIHLETRDKLPTDAVVDGTHVNIGVAYDQFGLFWMPVWNYSEAQYVLVSDDEETYWELDADTIAQLAKEYNVELSEKPSPSLWNKVGLKPVLALLLVAIVWGYLPGKKKESEE